MLHSRHSPSLWRPPFCLLVSSALAETGLQEVSSERGSLRHRNCEMCRVAPVIITQMLILVSVERRRQAVRGARETVLDGARAEPREEPRGE